MKLSEKLAKDNDRSQETGLNKVFLFKEGNFFRAFNRSAWLLAEFIYNEVYRQQIGAKDPLKVSHIVTKSGEDYLVAGFPIRSLNKYVGDCTVTEESEEVFTADIPSEKMPVFSYESFDALYQEYAGTIPVKEQKERKPAGEPSEPGTAGRRGLFDIIREIMNYQVEDSSPTDSMQFLIHIKREINQIL